MFPTFFIVGTPKAGTTSLYYYLDEHPEIFMSPIKEPNFFSHIEIIGQNLYYKEKSIGDRERYENLFEAVTTEKVIGEASVSYLFYKKTPERIKEEVPEARIIVILRNPIDRGFSHFLMDQRLGLVNFSFEDIVFKRIHHPMIDLYYQQFIEIGFYHDQVKRYFDVFGKEQVRVFLTEDLKNNLERVVLDVYDFLNIEDKRLPNLDRKHNVYRTPRNKIVKNLYSSKKIRAIAKTVIPDCFASAVKDYALIQDKKPELSENIKIYLNDLFHKDILLTSELIKRDLTYWFL